MDESRYSSRLSDPLEDSDSKIGHGAGSENTSRIAGIYRRDKTCSGLLGRRHPPRRSTQRTAPQRRRLSGNDRLRPLRSKCAVSPAYLPEEADRLRSARTFLPVYGRRLPATTAFRASANGERQVFSLQPNANRPKFALRKNLN